MDSWGKSMSCDVKGCEPIGIRDSSYITLFAKRLVKLLDMKAFGEPLLWHFGSDDKQGFTLVQLIETSNITAHFAEDTNSAYIDVFSCKDFDHIKVAEFCQSFFNGTSVKCELTIRD